MRRPNIINSIKQKEATNSPNCDLNKKRDNNHVIIFISHIELSINFRSNTVFKVRIVITVFVSAEEEMKMKSLTLFFFGILKIAVALVPDPKASYLQNIIKIEGKFKKDENLM